MVHRDFDLERLVDARCRERPAMDGGNIEGRAAPGNTGSRPGLPRRTRALAALVVLWLAAGAGAALAQIRPPIPPPFPFTEDCLNLMRNVREWSDENPEVRERASREAREIVRRERTRLLQQAIQDVGQGPPPPPREKVERRVLELLEESCIYQILSTGLKSEDGEVRARAKVGLDRFAPPPRKKDPREEQERRQDFRRLSGLTEDAVDEILEAVAGGPIPGETWAVPSFGSGEGRHGDLAGPPGEVPAIEALTSGKGSGRPEAAPSLLAPHLPGRHPLATPPPAARFAPGPAQTSGAAPRPGVPRTPGR